METKLRRRLIFILSFSFLSLSTSAWTGPRMRKSSAPPPPVSFANATITSIRPGQKWQLSATGGAPPYSFSLLSGTGSVSLSGLFTAATTNAATANVKVTDANGTSSVLSINNTMASVSMTSGALQIVADPQFLVYDSGGPSGNYGNSENGALIIRGDHNSTLINLIFDSYQTEAGYDFLKVYNGDTSTSILSSISGSSIPPTLTANLGAMILNFTSDPNTVTTGYQAHTSILPANVSLLHVNKYATELGVSENFVATGGAGPYSFAVVSGLGSIATSPVDPAIGIYTPGTATGDVTVRVTDATGSTFDESFAVGATNKLCTQTTSSADRGVLYDNGGPSAVYSSNSNCGFVIANAASGGKVELKFDYVQTEAGYDLIKIYDGPNASGTLLATYSGYFPTTATLTTTSNTMYISFVSDTSINYHGFRAIWKLLP